MKHTIIQHEGKLRMLTTVWPSLHNGFKNATEEEIQEAINNCIATSIELDPEAERVALKNIVRNYTDGNLLWVPKDDRPYEVELDGTLEVYEQKILPRVLSTFPYFRPRLVRFVPAKREEKQPLHPDEFGGSDEGSHYMSQTKVDKQPECEPHPYFDFPEKQLESLLRRTWYEALGIGYQGSERDDESTRLKKWIDDNRFLFSSFLKPTPTVTSEGTSERFHYFGNHGDEDGNNCYTICFRDTDNPDMVIVGAEDTEEDAQEAVKRLNNILDSVRLTPEPPQESLRELVDQQAEDEGLWFAATSATEAYLQQALRRLHTAIEEVKQQLKSNA